jgi:hypothetical protein
MGLLVVNQSAGIKGGNEGSELLIPAHRDCKFESYLRSQISNWEAEASLFYLVRRMFVMLRERQIKRMKSAHWIREHLLGC